MPVPLLLAAGGVAGLTWFYCCTPVGRWLAGHDGKDRTNATWSMHGEAPAPGAKRHRPFWHRPQWQRFLIRHAEALAPVLLGLGWWKARPWLTGIAITAAAVLLVTGAALLAAFLRRLPQHLAYVRPAHKALHRDFGQPPRARPGSWITRSRDGTRARLAIRPGGNLTKPADESRVGTAAIQLLGINDGTAHWRHGGKTPHLLLLGHKPLPPAVTWPEVEQDARGLPFGSVLLGPGWDERHEVICIPDGDPHGFCSYCSRYGKTTTARSWAAQLAAQGWLILICDAHFNSHPWAVGMPNVRVARTPADLTRAWLWAGAEGTRRAKDSLRRTSPDGSVQPSPWPHIGIVGEELGLQLPMLTGEHRRTSGRNNPGRAPALDGLTNVQHSGAGQGLHMLGIAQIARDDTLGGRGGRENHAYSMFCNPSPQAERMFGLTPGAVPKTRIRGRVHIRRDDMRPCQIAEMTNKQARAYALSGSVASWADYPGPPPFDYEDEDQADAASERAWEEGPANPGWRAWVVHDDGASDAASDADAASLPDAASRAALGAGRRRACDDPRRGCGLEVVREWAVGPPAPAELEWREAARELGAASRLAVAASAAVVPVTLRAGALGLGLAYNRLRTMRDRGRLAGCEVPGMVDPYGAKYYDLAALADLVGPAEGRAA